MKIKVRIDLWAGGDEQEFRAGQGVDPLLALRRANFQRVTDLRTGSVRGWQNKSRSRDPRPEGGNRGSGPG